VTELRQLTVGAEWKTAGDSSGELEGYASVFGNVDQGGDVVLPGAFKKTLSGWNQAKQPLPLLADHQLSTDGVIGSVVHAAEDHFGLRVKAKFSSIAKAQDVRVKMIEGHLRGMSFTYEPRRSYPGEKDGRRVRFLQEVKLFEITVTPFPMNQLALAGAKAGPDEHAEDEARLAELEAWAAAATARAVLEFEVEHPETVAYAAGVHVAAKDRHRLADLEAWALSQPYRSADPQAEAAQARRRRWDRADRYDAALAAWKSSVRDCGHRSCLPGACKYGG
jgi:HK97 family phage prohead protease